MRTGMAALVLADCNQYGWEPGWNIDGYYDGDGWVALGGVAWPNEANDVVGYFRLTYHSGQVAVSIAGEWSIGFDTDCQPAVFSTDPILIGEPDPNQMMQGGGADGSILEVKGSKQIPAESLEPLPPVPAEPVSDGGQTVYTMGAMDCNEVLDPNFYPNLNDDPFVDFADAAILAANWGASGPSLPGDLNKNETVGLDDLAILSYYWLANACGPSPEEVFDSFKYALASGDVNAAVAHFTEVAAEQYRILFDQLTSYLPQMADDMGELVFIEQKREMAVYDLLREEGEDIYGYPVVFVRDETGQWTIYDF